MMEQFVMLISPLPHQAAAYLAVFLLFVGHVRPHVHLNASIKLWARLITYEGERRARMR